ncbi:hypothetical protein K438DRAFT_2030434 [Mycena galopus ATCC 62051]|nr:hypothetical protein K438DRAFT_2030434 [Mycena galopus ATCC 62051]
MAEVLGLLATILQLVDTAATAGTLIRDLHNAPKEQQRLIVEIGSLKTLITALQDRTQKNSSIAGIQQIKEPLQNLEHTLKQCSKKLQPQGGPLSIVSKPLAWSLWNKNEVKEDLDKIERFKTLLNTWLTVDIWDIGLEQRAGHSDQQRDHSRILASIQRVADEQQDQIDTAERARIIEWLSPLNFFKRQADIFSTWQQGTGNRLLSDPHFQEWEASSGKVLWCRGMPGAGKTVLA